jgi:hypothetical protein
MSRKRHVEEAPECRPWRQAFSISKYQGRYYVVYPDGEISGLMHHHIALDYAHTFQGEVKKLPRNWWPLWLFLCTMLSVFIGKGLWDEAQGSQFKPLTRSEPIVRMVLQEAVAEPFEGMVAVAGVALDRMADSRWPNTRHGVIYQPWQFTGMRSRFGRHSRKDIERARRAVEAAEVGIRPCGKVFWYHTPKVSPSWAKRVQVSCRIGDHIFYGDPK